MTTCEIQFKKVGDKFIQTEGHDRYNKFKLSCPSGSLITASLEIEDEERSYEQIKKIHKLFRIMAEYSGNDVETIKLYMKYKAGYAYETEMGGIKMIVPLKSIGKMSKKDLSDLIEFTIHYAEQELNLIVE